MQSELDKATGGAPAATGDGDGAAAPGDGDGDAGAGGDDAAAAAKPAAAPGAPAAGDGAGDGNGDEDEEAKKAAAKVEAAKAEGAKVVARAATARAPAAKPAVTAEETELAKRVAVLEAEGIEREIEERITANAARIPASLQAFARRIAPDKAAFDEFVAGLPEPKGKLGVQAAASRTRGDGQGSADTFQARAAHLPPLDPEAKKSLERVFATAKRAEDDAVVLPDGRLRLTHLAAPKKPAIPGAGDGATKGADR